MPDTNPTKPTAGAMRAMGLAQLVNKVFAAERVKSTTPGHPGYRVEMAPPQGRSTTATQAQERLVLVPLDTKAGEVPVVFGTADTALTEARLRSFELLAAQHAEHFGDALAIDAGDYGRLLDKMKQFFEHQGAPVTIAAAASVAPQPAPKKPSVVPWIVVTLVVMVTLAVLAVRMR
jgi:hypothetical protein